MARKKVAKKTSKKGYDYSKHNLMPKHTKLGEKEKQNLLKQYKIVPDQLPSILLTDSAIQNLNPEDGDIIKVERSSLTAKTTFYYRRVVNGK